ncbi:MAG: tetratricopeptide repeat protein [Bacteroidia bacterium]
MKKNSFIFLLFFTGLLFPQNPVDSLKRVLKTVRNDTSRCAILSALAENAPDNEWPAYNNELLKLSSKKINETNGSEKQRYEGFYATALCNLAFLAHSQGGLQKAESYYKQALEIQEKLSDKKAYANTLYNLGFIYDEKGDYRNAVATNLESLAIQEKINDKAGASITYYHLGLLYHNKGDITKALDYYAKSLKIKEETGDREGTAKDLNNIALIYEGQGDVTKALDYYHRSFKLFEETGDKPGMGYVLNNIGTLFFNSHDLQKAIEYQKRSLSVREETGDKSAISNSLNNLGVICRERNQPEEARTYFERALEQAEEAGDQAGLALALRNLGGLALAQNKMMKALDYGNKSLAIARAIGQPESIKNAAGLLMQAYRANGDYKACFENYDLFIRMRDSLSNEATRKASVRSQLKYEYEKKAVADSTANAQKAEISKARLDKQAAELKARRIQQYILFGGLIMVLIFSGILFNRFKIISRQKRIIEQKEKETQQQKNQLETRQKEILDSIRYAQRIQGSLLPREDYIVKTLARLRDNQNKS